MTSYVVISFDKSQPVAAFGPFDNLASTWDVECAIKDDGGGAVVLDLELAPYAWCLMGDQYRQPPGQRPQGWRQDDKDAPRVWTCNRCGQLLHEGASFCLDCRIEMDEKEARNADG